MIDSDLERRLERMFAGFEDQPVDVTAAWRRFTRLRRHAARTRRLVAARTAAAVIVAAAVATAVGHHGTGGAPAGAAHRREPARGGQITITARIRQPGAGKGQGDVNIAGQIVGQRGQVWGMTYSGYLYKIDPRINRVTFHEHLAGLAGVAVGGGAVWVLTTAGGAHSNLLKLDPVTGRVVARFSPPRRCGEVAYGGSQLWLACGSNATTFLRLDPASGRVLAKGGSVHNLTSIAATADGIWYANDRGVSGFAGQGSRLRWLHAANAAIPVTLGSTDSLVYGQGFVWAFTNDEGVAKIDPATGRIVRIYGYQGYDPSYSMGLDFLTVGQNSLWFLADSQAQASSVLRVSMATGRPQGEVPGVGSCGEPCWQIYFAGGSVWVPTRDHVTRIDPVRPQRRA
jgi:hypothetical protein